MNMIFDRKNPKAPLWVTREDGSRTVLQEFRFQIPNAPANFYHSQTAYGDLSLPSGSGKPGDLTVTVRFKPGIGYVFRLDKKVGNKIITNHRALIKLGKHEREFQAIAPRVVSSVETDNIILPGLESSL